MGGQIFRPDFRWWDEQWADKDFSPTWRIDDVVEPVIRASEDGWLPAGASVLDIGCGLGHIAAWLAERDYDVVGVDFSAAAVERARELHAATPRLAFEVVDVTQPGALPMQFDSLIDRGCLHGIRRRNWEAYADNVRAWAKPGAAFLLLAHCLHHPVEQLTVEVRDLLTPAFELIDVAPTSMAATTEDESLLPGAVFRLQRQ